MTKLFNKKKKKKKKKKEEEEEEEEESHFGKFSLRFILHFVHGMLYVRLPRYNALDEHLNLVAMTTSLVICRGIPERVYPFSKGVCHNLYDFCCHRSNIYNLEPLPSAQMLEERSRPYTCSDIMRCRCC